MHTCGSCRSEAACEKGCLPCVGLCDGMCFREELGDLAVTMYSHGNRLTELVDTHAVGLREGPVSRMAGC